MRKFVWDKHNKLIDKKKKNRFNRIAFGMNSYQCRLGGLRSVAQIFSPLLGRKSRGFARIYITQFVLPENGYLDKYRVRWGGVRRPSPPPPVRLCLWICFSKRNVSILMIYNDHRSKYIYKLHDFCVHGGHFVFGGHFGLRGKIAMGS